jgi:anti-sigma B factor antagonist
MRVAVSRSAGGVRVTFHGGDALDAANAGEIKEAILPTLDGVMSVVVDLGGVDFVDSAGVGVLVAVYKAMRSKGGRARYCGLRPGVRAVLAIIRLDEILEIADDPVSA